MTQPVRSPLARGEASPRTLRSCNLSVAGPPDAAPSPTGDEEAPGSIDEHTDAAEAPPAPADEGSPQRPAGDDEMSFWTFFVLALGAGALASCAAPIDSNSGGDGGSGAAENLTTGAEGVGGATGTSSSASSSASVTSSIATSSSVSTTVSSSTGGPMACDSNDPTACAACQQCAVTGMCSAAYGACQSNAECVALNGCLNGCMGDAACEDGCKTAHPMGQSDLANAANCVYCQACYMTCNGKGFGCP